MKIHYLQHVPFEGLGYIKEWIIHNGGEISCTKLYAKEELPNIQDVDWLIILGGPMSVHDDKIYPWLLAEKNFIKKAIIKGKIILGICLGAQLIADVLGANIFPGQEKEIGWFPIAKSPELSQSSLNDIFPEKVNVFHWHGETFHLPQDAIPLAKSQAIENQGFVFQEKVIALQFHLESTLESVQALIEHCSDELVKAPYVQSAEEMLYPVSGFSEINRLMAEVLDYQMGFYKWGGLL